MRNDNPTSRRMGFGYKAHQKAGVPWSPPTTASAHNLGVFIKARPHLRSVAEAMLKAGKSGDTIIYDLRCDGCDGDFSLAYWRDRDGEDWREEIFKRTEAEVREKFVWAKTNGADHALSLHKRDPSSGIWTEFDDWIRPENENLGEAAVPAAR
jgi:hypothetical protein